MGKKFETFKGDCSIYEGAQTKLILDGTIEAKNWKISLKVWVKKQQTEQKTLLVK